MSDFFINLYEGTAETSVGTMTLDYALSACDLDCDCDCQCDCYGGGCDWSNG